MKDLIELTYEQWNRLGFLIKKGSTGTKMTNLKTKETYFVFGEHQVISQKEYNNRREELLDRASGCPDY